MKHDPISDPLDPSASPPSFEQAVERLESLIEQIESGEVGLEDALQQYEDGTKLILHCRGILDRAEQKIAELSLDDKGGVADISDEHE
jgi:exodeoxyribonuclease VII small subunit